MTAPPRNIADFTDVASNFFKPITGQSPRIKRYYKSLPEEFLNKPITPENIGELVRGENEAALGKNETLNSARSTGLTPAERRADWMAALATPGRGVAAHFWAQNMAIASEGHFADNEYSRSALSELLSGTFT